MKLNELDKKTAEDMAVQQFTDMYNKFDEKDLDIPKLELVLRNTFSAGVLWKKSVMEKEAKAQNSYIDGLEHMFDAAQKLYDDADYWSDFYDKLLIKKDILERY